MSPHPPIFISAVSKELKTARQLVANTLTFLGYQPIWQDIFGTETGDLREMLREKIDECTGVIQLVGQCYGMEPPTPEPKMGRISYTQYEATYARQRGKKVWYFVLDETFATDQHDPEPAESRELQAVYRRRLQQDAHLYHGLETSAALENKILKLRNELSRLRRGINRWAFTVAALLIALIAIGLWLLHTVSDLKRDLAKLRVQGVPQYAAIKAELRDDPRDPNPAEIEDAAYTKLAKKLGLDPKFVKDKLPQIALELKNATNANPLDRANAAYISKDYVTAEQFALQAAEESKNVEPPQTSTVITALELAGWAAQGRFRYADALGHFSAAEKLTDRRTNPLQWARIKWDLAATKMNLGQYREAEQSYRLALPEYEKAGGPQSRAVLTIRHNLGIALYYQYRYSEVESEYRALLPLLTETLGREDRLTLNTRMSLASALNALGQHVEAETEQRKVLELKLRVMEPNDPDVLWSRGNLAVALWYEGRYADAETEFRKVLEARTSALGEKDPLTLKARQELTSVLVDMGRFAEAEDEFRTVLSLREKVLGPRHRETLRTCYMLAATLWKQNKTSDAQDFAKRAAETAREALGPNDPDTQRYYKFFEATEGQP